MDVCQLYGNSCRMQSGFSFCTWCCAQNPLGIYAGSGGVISSQGRHTHASTDCASALKIAAVVQVVGGAGHLSTYLASQMGLYSGSYYILLPMQSWLHLHCYFQCIRLIKASSRTSIQDENYTCSPRLEMPLQSCFHAMQATAEMTSKTRCR